MAKVKEADPPKYITPKPDMFGLGLWDEYDEDFQRSIKIAQGKAKRRSRVRDAREDVNAFAEYAIKNRKTGEPIQQADVHREMQAAMADTEHKRTLIEISRDHGKTTQSLIRVLHETGKDPNRVTKIICESDKPATKRLEWIKEQVEKNTAVHDVFPNLKPGRQWDKTAIRVERDDPSVEPTIEACGVTSSATGGRMDEGLFDDPVGRRNALSVPALRQTVRSAINSDWLMLLEPTSIANVLCTGWTNDDWIHDAKNNEAWHVIRRPTIGYKSPWPEKWTEEALRDKKKLVGSTEYARGFELIPLSGEIVCVNPEWIKYWDFTPAVENLIIFDAYDLSTGEGKKSDFFAGVTIGLDPSPPGRFYVVKAWHSRLSFLQQIQAVKAHTMAVRPDMIGFEATQYQAVLPQLFREKMPIAKIVSIKPRLSKALRLQAITPVMEQGRVLFNPSLEPSRIRDPEGVGDLVGEATQFPLARNDDLVDAFVHAMTMAIEYLVMHVGGGAVEDQDDGDDDWFDEEPNRKGALGGYGW